VSNKISALTALHRWLLFYPQRNKLFSLTPCVWSGFPFRRSLDIDSLVFHPSQPFFLSKLFSAYIQLPTSLIHNPSTLGVFTTRDIPSVSNCFVHNLFLGFWNNRRLASLCHSISMSIRLKQHDSHRTDFCGTSYLGLSFKFLVTFRFDMYMS
jgi:hypothetical protein